MTSRLAPLAAAAGVFVLDRITKLWIEAHVAVYPPGTRYAPHRDRFRADDRRVLSSVLYLNERWTVSDGGALRLYVDDGAVEVLPHAGTLVTFLSERFLHEVLPARRPRMAVTGWALRR